MVLVNTREQGVVQANLLSTCFDPFSILVLMFLGLAVVACSVTQFPGLAPRAALGFFKALEWNHQPDAHFSGSQRFAWNMSYDVSTFALALAFYYLIHALVNYAVNVAGLEFYGASAFLLMENARGWVNVTLMFLVYIPLLACMSLPAMFWLLRIDIQMQVGRRVLGQCSAAAPEGETRNDARPVTAT